MRTAVTLALLAFSSSAYAACDWEGTSRDFFLCVQEHVADFEPGDIGELVDRVTELEAVVDPSSLDDLWEALDAQGGELLDMYTGIEATVAIAVADAATAVADAATAQASADAAQATADSALANADAAQATADSALANADAAQATADAALASADTAQATADAALASADSAQASADAALSAGLAASASADTAQSTADGAVADAAAAQSTADDAVSDAAAARSAADDAQDDADANAIGISGVAGDLADLEDDLEAADALTALQDRLTTDTYEVVINDGYSGDYFNNCPGDDIVTGGGCDVVSDVDGSRFVFGAMLYNNAPNSVDQGWRCSIFNDSGEDVVLTVMARCLDI